MNLYETAISNVAWINLPRGVLHVEGRDATKWLHKIVTANVEKLQAGHGAHSALLDAKGHFVAEFILMRDGDAYNILVEPDAREILYNALRRYIIREKVTLTDVSAQWECFTFIGNESANLAERVFHVQAPNDLYAWSAGDFSVRVIRTMRARVLAFEVLAPKDAAQRFADALRDVPHLSDELLEILRIEAGLPKWGVDFDNTTLALEIPDVMQIRVDQGCYVGQEVVARIVHRGHVNRYLRGLMDSDVLFKRGDVIRFENAEVGTVTSAAHSPTLGNIALSYVRREVEIGAYVQINEANARMVELPFSLE
jgi:tRNA-modifying protein YgfZ